MKKPTTPEMDTAAGFYKLLRPQACAPREREVGHRTNRQASARVSRRSSTGEPLWTECCAQMIATDLVFLHIGGDRSVLTRLVDHQSI